MFCAALRQLSTDHHRLTLFSQLKKHQLLSFLTKLTLFLCHSCVWFLSCSTCEYILPSLCHSCISFLSCSTCEYILPSLCHSCISFLSRFTCEYILHSLASTAQAVTQCDPFTDKINTNHLPHSLPINIIVVSPPPPPPPYATQAAYIISHLPESTVSTNHPDLSLPGTFYLPQHVFSHMLLYLAHSITYPKMFFSHAALPGTFHHKPLQVSLTCCSSLLWSSRELSTCAQQLCGHVPCRRGLLPTCPAASGGQSCTAGTVHSTWSGPRWSHSSTAGGGPVYQHGH